MENNGIHTETLVQPSLVITPDALLEHWQGHRKLTRKIIEAFPDEKLFSYSVGGMRPFSELALEMITMCAPGIRGVVTGKWQTSAEYLPKASAPKTKSELLKLWDEVTTIINSEWPKIAPGRFQEKDVAFGQYEGTIYWVLFYFIDNEIHHRGQGYVYLRSLGIAPPPFWDRA
jgi:uncharacterized damage-inducible protein DinB